MRGFRSFPYLMSTYYVRCKVFLGTQDDSPCPDFWVVGRILGLQFQRGPGVIGLPITGPHKVPVSACVIRICTCDPSHSGEGQAQGLRSVQRWSRKVVEKRLLASPWAETGRPRFGSSSATFTAYDSGRTASSQTQDHPSLPEGAHMAILCTRAP